MALFIPGGVAGGAPSGSVGSVVFSHNRYGAYMRSRVIPTNPSSYHQQVIRNACSSLANLWYNTLTGAQRDGWETYAANVPVINRIGQQIYLNGLNWYIACNTLRIQWAGTLTRIDDAPTTFTLASFTGISISASEATQLVSVTYVDDEAWTLDDGALGIYGARPQNASHIFNAHPFRFAAAVEGDTVSPPASPQTAAYPFTFVQGQRLFVRLQCVIADGRIGSPQKFLCDATA